MVTRRTALAALAGAPAGLRSVRCSQSRPNIVIILADDLGYGDVGFTGCPDIRTPNIDRLAAGGVHFTHAYSNGAVCSPTRTALLTGRYQQRHGMDAVIYVDERDRGLDPRALLFPALLKQAGYATGIVGKWHLGFRTEFFPTRRGFDEFVGFVAGNIDYFAHTDRLGNADLWRNEEPISDSRYMTELIGDESISFIDRHAGTPFFLYVAFNAPHDPFQGPADRDTPGDRKRSRQGNPSRATYKSMIESLDQHAGRIIDHLKKRGLEESTAVFFFSDNGAVPGIGRNLPFRGFKGSLWEGGIRTPLVASWRGQFSARSRTSEMAAGMDLFPTCLSLAGAKLPSGHVIDGVDLLGVCRGQGTLQRDTLYFHYRAPRDTAQYAMIRRGWKYLRDRQEKEYLFHLAEDPGETTDRATSAPARLESMKPDYEAWKKTVNV